MTNNDRVTGRVPVKISASTAGLVDPLVGVAGGVAVDPQRRTAFLRFAHEWNRSWCPWAVNANEIGDFIITW